MWSFSTTRCRILLLCASLGDFTLSISVNAEMLLIISFWLNCLNFKMRQVSCSKNGSHFHLIRYYTRVDTKAPNQSLMLSVKGHLNKNYSPLCISRRRRRRWARRWHTRSCWRSSARPGRGTRRKPHPSPGAPSAAGSPWSNTRP